MVRVPPALILCLAVATAAAQEAPSLAGSIEGDVYVSPTGAYKIKIPVLPALGGVVRDTDKVVTFRDNFGLQVSVGAFPQDATQKWELSTRGIKDYLIYFFSNLVLPDFRQFCPGTHAESAGFSADLLDGTLFTYILLPGGSMFNAPRIDGDTAAAPVAKRGNMIFVRNGSIYVISTELAERETERSTYKKTIAEENEILRSRLVDLVRKMEFARPDTTP